jgi:hypothetical protein
MSYGDDVIFALTADDVLACANQLGIPKEQVTADVMELIKMRLGNWSDVVKNTLWEATKCPLGLVCYPSCACWQHAKCTFPGGKTQR